MEIGSICHLRRMTGDACVPVWYKDVTSRPQSGSFIGRLTHWSLWVCSSIPSNAAVVPSSVRCSVWYPAVCACSLWKKKKKNTGRVCFCDQTPQRASNLRAERKWEWKSCFRFVFPLNKGVCAAWMWIFKENLWLPFLPPSSFQCSKLNNALQLAVDTVLIRHPTSKFKVEK